MKKLLSLVFASTLATSLACAENFTQCNVDMAQAIIDAAVEAHGGDALLRDRKFLSLHPRLTRYLGAFSDSHFGARL
jgi:hypothetical protein